MTINPIKYPFLYQIMKESINVDSETKVEDGFLKFKFELSVKIPDSLAQLFD